MKHTIPITQHRVFSIPAILVIMLLMIAALFPLVQAAPGGVSGNLQLWLKANAGTSTTTDGNVINTWNDQSGMTHNGSSTGTARPLFKNATADLINFNPVVRFDKTDDEILLGDPLGIVGTNSFTIFSLQKISAASSGTILGSDTTSHTPGPYYQYFINNVIHNIHAGNVFIDGSTTTVNDGIPHLSSARRAGNDFYLYHAGAVDAGSTTNTISFSGANKAIGSAYSSQYFGGDIAEVIIYNVGLSDSERQKVDSYLALKYGITLDSTIDYLASDGTTIYPSTSTHSTHTNDIAGIGTDNGSNLSQPKSRSVNSDSIITITGSGIADGHFLIWGNDDSVLTFSSTEIPGGGKRLVREWKIAETGDVGTVTLSFDLSSIASADLSNATKFSLLTDADGNFSDATMITGGTINGSAIEFSGVSLNNGQYFSLGYNNVTSLVVDNTGDTDDGDYSTGQNTLREAIANANASDTITFDSSIAGLTIVLSNQLTIDKDLTIDGSGQNITISGGDTVRVFEVMAGTVTFESLMIADGNDVANTNTGGGIIINSGATMTISNSTLSNNTAKIGGAIRNNGFLTIKNSTISGNIAPGAAQFGGRGGGIFAGGGTLTINNSTFANNQGKWRGGAFYNGNSTTTINNSTFAYNQAINGGGFYRANGTISIQNTIIALNTGNAKNCHGANTGANNISNQGCGGVVFTGDPKLGSLQDNGGDTQTIALLPSSPAINTGDNTTCSSIGNLDQRGITRPQTTTCDIGAYEKRAPAFSSTHQTSVNVNAAYSYSITTTDNEPTDNESPIINVPTKPTWLTLTDNGNGTGTLTGTPTPAELGIHNVTLRLNDGTENIDQTFTITVNKLDQIISFGALSDKMEGNLPFAINATATSGLSVGFSASGNCTISGNSITISSVGNCTITASQSGNAEYNAAPNISQSFSIVNQPPPSYRLTVNKIGSGTIIGNGISCGSDCDQYFEQGTSVTLTATPNANFVFDGFSGDCDEKGTVLINEDKSCTATFLRERTLTISTNGQGIVNDCGTECIQVHLDGKTVQLSVTPDDGVALSNWQGDCDNDGKVLMNSNKSCTANFTQGFTLKVTLIGKGTVTGENLNCSENCTVNFPNDTVVTLKAIPDVEWILEGFTGDCDSTGNVQMTEDKTCTITFVEDANIPNNGDGNGDSIKDIEQNNIVSIPDLVAGDYLTLEVELTCSIDDIYADKPENQGNYDDAYEFPQGIMYFDLGCAETDVIIYFHALQNAQNPILQKYGPTTPGDLNTLDWFAIPNVVFGTAMIGGKSVVTGTYHLVDGELGDHTGVDGRIIDPVGLSFQE